ncbi:hypothetical protein IFM89_034589 [Coptis chinensis]|uniref:RRM domain-containing protein n=1 Tax=Coptis chinensis TaxID=261450 RepID=A0A835HP94_9MAGN|nr:hypothetical protein IFM89_034589 [Coptis chinensis]
MYNVTPLEKKQEHRSHVAQGFWAESVVLDIATKLILLVYLDSIVGIEVASDIIDVVVCFISGWGASAAHATIRLMLRNGKGEQRVCKVFDSPNLLESEAISRLTGTPDFCDKERRRYPRQSVEWEPRGFGFVPYVDPDDAAKAKYQMDGQVLHGRGDNGVCRGDRKEISR